MNRSAGALTQFKNYTASISDLSDYGWNKLQQAVTILEVKRGAILLSEGEKCNMLFFIVEGYCQAYYNKDGLDIITGFFFENDFATNVKSLVTGLPSQYFIRTCEATVIVRLDKEKLHAAYEDAAEIATFGRKMLEILLARQEEITDQFRLLSAQERYEYLLVYNPEMLQRVSLTQLSSYVGISRETLSRIRRRIAQR